MPNWLLQNAPFFALVSASPPPNRPMFTRLIEQSTVGIVAAAITLYATQQTQATQITNIAALAHRDREELRAEQRELARKIDALTIILIENRYPKK